MKRLGVIGTMVWDTIYGRPPHADPVEEWGGIAYALGAFEAFLPAEWELVPLIKVGRDMARRAQGFLGSLNRVADSASLLEVEEPNNRVTLHYTSETRRTERLVGGVPGWTRDELATGGRLAELDALYINFISGREADLETCAGIRSDFQGPIYADLHSLLLGVGADGTRVPRPLAQPGDWFSCFDVVQVNEDEMHLIGPDPMEVAAIAFDSGVRLLLVTLGPRGAVYFTQSGRIFGPRQPEPQRAEPIRTALVPAPVVHEPGDPTGCGDVFGARMFSLLLEGEDVAAATAMANEAGARNYTGRGALGLHHHLRNEIAPR